MCILAGAQAGDELVAVAAPPVRDERLAVPDDEEELRRGARRADAGGSASRQMGQFWMNRLWRQKVGTGPTPC